MTAPSKAKVQATDSTVVGLLEIKMGACLTAPTRAMHADLRTTARECNRARNGIVRAWQRWREDHADWTPEPVISKKTGEPLRWKGRVKVKNELLPREEGGRLLYAAGRAVAPAVAAKIASGCLQEVSAHLTADTPYNHEGEAHYRWQAILTHEISAPTFRSLVIPAQSQDIVLCYAGYAVSGNTLSATQATALRVPQGAAVLRFALFSKEAGRAKGYHVCRLEVRQMSAGNRNVLRRVASGQWKLSDSKIVWKEGKRPGTGHWSFQLTYRQPVRALGLDHARVAVLVAHDGKAPQPFTVAPEGNEHFRPWVLGQLRTLQEQYRRLEMRRRSLRSDYRTAGSGVKGHGRKRFLRDVRRPTRSTRHLMELFTEKMVHEVINRFCVRFNCGTLLYDEPPVARRSKLWLAVNNIDFNWTALLQKLQHKCKLHGIVLTSSKDRKK